VLISGIRLDGGNMGIGDGAGPVGITVFSSVNVDIGNCEIYGWSGTGIEVLDPRNRLELHNASAVRIHDSYIHHNRHWGGQGYGVKTNAGGHALIERNVFDYNRHALASSGDSGTSYRAYDNLLLAHGGENFLRLPLQHDDIRRGEQYQAAGHADLRRRRHPERVHHG
jgi:hypothetical protein